VNTVFESKLPDVGTTIFTVMSRLANECGAINLSQGFPDFDGTELGQGRLQFFPDPASDIFAGGIFQSWNVVQVVVVQLIVDGFEALFQFRKIHDPAGRLRRVPAH